MHGTGSKVVPELKNELTVPTKVVLSKQPRHKVDIGVENWHFEGGG